MARKPKKRRGKPVRRHPAAMAKERCRSERRRHPTDDERAGLPPLDLKARRRTFAESSSQEIRAAMSREVADLRAEILAGAQPFDPLHLLASSVAWFGFAVPEVYREVTQEPTTTIEYLASVLLEGPDRPVGDAPDDPQAFNDALMDARQRVRRIGFLSVGARLAAVKEPEPWARLSAVAQAHRLGVRGSGYQDVAETVFRDVMATAEGVVESVLGLRPSEVIDVTHAIDQHMQEGMNRRLRQAHADADRVVADPGFAPLGGGSRRQAQEREAALRQGALVWAFNGPGIIEDLTFTSAEISAATGLPADRLTRFLDAFSTPFEAHRGTNLLTEQASIVLRPLVKRGDRYLCTSPGNLLWGLRPVIEQRIQDAGAWPRYDAGRAAAVEARCEEALASGLDSDQHWRNLKFDIEGSGGYEVDVLVRQDNLCVIAEAKAGGVDSRRLRAGLRSTVGKASEQTTRLREALRAGRDVRFYSTQTGQTVDVDLRGVDRFEAVVVTLEDLSFLNGEDDLLRETGILPDGTQAPWTVSIYDLEEICATASPAALALYLSEQRRVRPRLIGPFDELDLWMCFLMYGLALPEAAYVRLETTFTEDLDRFRMLGDGEQPALRLPTGAGHEIQRLSSERRPGWLSRAEAAIADSRAGYGPAVGLSGINDLARALER